jgi:hypothetical protein
MAPCGPISFDDTRRHTLRGTIDEFWGILTTQPAERYG